MMLPPGWNAKLANHQLCQDDDIQQEAIGNMLVFPLSELSSATVDPEALDRFLVGAFQAFLTKAAKIRFTGWFYAWFDEMSGSLRCSACSVTVPGELPFSCALNIVDTPGMITRAAASSKYISGIPAAEFQDVDSGAEHEVEAEFRLTVFGRQLLRAV